MASNPLSRVIQQLRHTLGAPATDPVSDGQLVRRFAEQRDEGAFALLIERFGPMVLGVCRRLLWNPHDAEDAFQATFVLLVQKAGSLREEELVGNWLYGVACRIARRARARAARCGPQTSEIPDMATAQAPPEGWNEIRPLLDDELGRLPRKYRLPLVLCYLEGKSNEAAARQLRWPAGTVKTRLAKGRDLLRTRLARRGVTLTAGALATVLGADVVCAAVPIRLADATLTAATLYAAGHTAGALSVPVTELVRAAASEMFRARLQAFAAAFLAFALLGTGTGIIVYRAWADTGPVAAPAAAVEPGPSRPELEDGGLAASVARQIRDWEPTRAERRFDEIAWTGNLRDGLRLARQHGRPVFLVNTSGRIETGRSCASATNLRASAFSNDRVIELLNDYFVPVYLASADYAADGPAAPEEKEELGRIRREAAEAGLAEVPNHTWLLSPEGHPVAALEACHAAMADKLVGLLEGEVRSRSLAKGRPLLAPALQSRPRAHAADELVLHLTARYLQRRGDDLVPESIQLGQSTNYFSRGCPGENWIVLAPSQWRRFLPRGETKVGVTWEVDAGTLDPISRLMYPPTEDNDVARNHIDQGTLTATVVALHDGFGRARLDGNLRMKHRFAPERDDQKMVDAHLTGFLDFGPSQPVALHLVSTRATYGKSDFGVAVRSLP